MLIAGTAIWQQDVGVLRVTGFVCAVIAVLLFGVMGIFGLDVLSMRQLRPAEAQAGVLAGGVFQEIKYFVAAFVLGFFGYGSLRTARSLAANRPKKPGIVSSAG